VADRDRLRPLLRRRRAACCLVEGRRHPWPPRLLTWLGEPRLRNRNLRPQSTSRVASRPPR
jgi:hypothetical protein